MGRKNENVQRKSVEAEQERSRLERERLASEHEKELNEFLKQLRILKGQLGVKQDEIDSKHKAKSDELDGYLKKCDTEITRIETDRDAANATSYGDWTSEACVYIEKVEDKKTA